MTMKNQRLCLVTKIKKRKKTMIKLMIRLIKMENKKHNFKKRFKHLLI